MKKLPVGIDDYKEIIEGDYVYVDKTLFIQEIVDRGTKLALIPRPRRFGKTINMSMLRYFFEKTKEDHSFLFSPYKIWQTEYRELQGKYPVIFFTLKGVKQETWELAYEKLKALIAKEFERHRYLLDSNEGKLSSDEKKLFQAILNQETNQANTELSLNYLTAWLERYHGERVIVLIDEYDAPIHSAYFHEFYPTIINFMHNWLGDGLKSNASLEKAVITGIMRIAKENIFSDLNHSTNFTTFSEDFGDKFGLLEEEVSALLMEYGMENKLEDVRSWYNGYKMGNYSVYNPWSIIKYIQHKTLEPYWVGTSGNDLIKEQLIEKGTFFKEDFETLLLGKSITKSVDQGLVFASLKDSIEAVWGLLLFSGYLTLAEMPNRSRTRYSCKLKIPNQEVLNLFQDMIEDYFSEKFLVPIPSLIEDLLAGNVKAFSEKFEKFILNVFSAFDVPKTSDLSTTDPERVYHAFVLGLIASLSELGYEIKSNRESGLGRYDVCLFPKDPSKLGVIFEFKKATDKMKNLSKLADFAIKQIETLHYVTELKDRGIQKILALGFGFKGKDVHVKSKFIQ